MIYHDWINTGIQIEDIFNQGMRDTVDYMTKPTKPTKPKKTKKTGVGKAIKKTIGTTMTRIENAYTEYYTQQAANGYAHYGGGYDSKTGKYVRGGGHKRLVKSPLTDYCDETKRFELKTRLVSFLNKKYLLRHGTGSLGFIVMYKNDFTIAHVYKKKEKDWISTKRFSGKLGWKEVKELIFEHAVHIADVKKKEDRPFKTIHRQAIITQEEFEEKFKPNEQMKKSYTSTAKDTALTSLSEILEDIDTVELRAGTHSAALNNVFKAITFTKHSYTGDLPAVSIYAIWCNFDPESKLVNTVNFDFGEPVLYQYEVME